MQGLARCREHGAAGQRQAGGDGPRAVAEAVPAAAGKDVGDELRVVGDAELLGAERLRGAELKRQAEQLPGLDGQGRLAGAGREALAVGDHRRAVEDGDGQFAGRLRNGRAGGLSMFSFMCSLLG